jgi:hypothetical protein
MEVVYRNTNRQNSRISHKKIGTKSLKAITAGADPAIPQPRQLWKRCAQRNFQFFTAR